MSNEFVMIWNTQEYTCVLSKGWGVPLCTPGTVALILCQKLVNVHPTYPPSSSPFSTSPSPPPPQPQPPSLLQIIFSDFFPVRKCHLAHLVLAPVCPILCCAWVASSFLHLRSSDLLDMYWIFSVNGMKLNCLEWNWILSYWIYNKF